MSGLAFVSARSDPSNLAPLVSQLAAAAPHRGEPQMQRGAAEAALAALEHEEPATHARAATASDRAGRLIVADTRLDERNDLARRLELDPNQHLDAALILAAFARWGDDCADHLRGDFAFVIWDAPNREVFAARDIFGLRPLYYAATRQRFLTASELAQLLESGAVEREFDDRSLLAAMVGRTAPPAWTPFQGVRRLPPGHILRATASGVRTRPFWRPARDAEDRELHAIEYAEELAALFERAIADRLHSATDPALLLSGGIDSTSIAATGATLRVRDDDLPVLRTYSFDYAGFPEADERSVSGQLTRLTGQPNTIVPSAEAYPFAEAATQPPDLDGPELLQSHALLRRTAELARGDGVDLLMTGHRADSLFGREIFDDLNALRTRGVRKTWHHLRQRATSEGASTRAIIQRDLVRRVVPTVWPSSRDSGLRRRLRQATRRRGPVPPWVQRDALAAHRLDPPPPEAIPRSSLAGDARRRRHEELLFPSQAGSTEYLERINAQAGIRYADPWADRRIADWVLAIPPARIAGDGTNKWVEREAMRGIVPEFARDSRLRAHPTSFYQHGILEAARPTIEEFLVAPVTTDRGFTDAPALRAAYERYRTGTWPGLGEWSAFWRWLTLEHWLRAHAA